MTHLRRAPVLAAALALAASPALAHHPLAGMPMTTALHGVLSGVGHPIIGLDHLAFVALAGLAARLAGHPLLLPLAYVAATMLGVAATTSGAALPAAEIGVALSLLALGGLVLAGRGAGRVPLALLLAGFGLFHGGAFGSAMAGVEAGASAAVLAGYLAGLAVTQYLLAVAAGWVGARLGAVTAAAPEARIAGALVAGIGLFLGWEHAEAAAFGLIG